MRLLFVVATSLLLLIIFKEGAAPPPPQAPQCCTAICPPATSFDQWRCASEYDLLVLLPRGECTAVECQASCTCSRLEGHWGGPSQGCALDHYPWQGYRDTCYRTCPPVVIGCWRCKHGL